MTCAISLLLALLVLLAGAVLVLLVSRVDRNLSWLGAGSVGAQTHWSSPRSCACCAGESEARQPGAW